MKNFALSRCEAAPFVSKRHGTLYGVFSLFLVAPEISGGRLQEVLKSKYASADQ